MATFLFVSLLLFYPYLLGPDMGSIIVARLEGTSVSLGCEIRKLWKGWGKYAMGSEVGPLFSWTVPCRGFEELLSATGCEISKLWKGVVNIAEDETAVSAPSMLFCSFF